MLEYQILANKKNLLKIYKLDIALKINMAYKAVGIIKKDIYKEFNMYIDNRHSWRLLDLIYTR